MKGFSLIIRYLLVIVLAVAIIVFTFLNIASSTVLNKDYVVGKLEETKYYENVFEDIKAEFENNEDQLPVEDVDLVDLISEEQVKIEAKQVIDNIYDGTDIKIDTEELRIDLTSRINEAVASNKIKLSAADEGTIDTYINRMCDEYSKGINQTEDMQSVRNLYIKIVNLVDLVKKGLLITMLVTLLLILGICYKRVFKVLSSTGIAFMLSGLFEVGSKFLVANYQTTVITKINTILELDRAMSNTAQNVLEDVMQKVMINGAVFVGIGILLVCVGCLVDRYRNKDKE